MIQAPRPGDEFQRLGMKVDFDLDPKELEKRYFAFQRKFHPDRFATKTPREKQLSLQHATDLNEAYDRLKTPLSRAEALLEAKGAGKQDQARTESDPELLMEAMESREALEAAETADEVAKLEASTRMDVEVSEEALSLAFSADDLEGATNIVTRLKYLLKLLQEIRRKRLSLHN
jgi:molecular chaperone HscB